MVKKKSLCENVKVYLIFAIFVLVNLIFNILKHINFQYGVSGLEWQNIEMIMTYKYGFIRRGLMGTIAYLISEVFGIERYSAIRGIQLAGEVILCVAIILMMFYFINSCKDKTTQMIVILLFCIFLQLGGFGFYLYDWGEPDIYMVSLTLLAVFLILKERFCWLVISISCIGEMIHEGFALMYFPIIFALLFYSFYEETDKNKKKKKFIVLFLTTLFTAVLFFYFYFFSTPILKYSYESIIKDVEKVYPKELKSLLSDNIKYIWFGAETYAKPMWADGKPTWEFYNRLVAFICAVIVLLPSISYILILWLTRVKNQKEKHKFLSEAAVFLSVAVVLPLLVYHADTTRWVYDIVLYECIILSVVTIKDGANTVKIFNENKILSNNIIKILFVCYVCVSSFLLEYNKWYVFENGIWGIIIK